MSWSIRKYTSPQPFPCEMIAEPAILTKEDLDEDCYIEISNKRIVIDLTHDKSGLLFFGIGFLLVACIFFFGNEPNPSMVHFKYVFGAIFLMMSTPFFFYLKYRPQRLLIFDRENQLVTLPFRLWGKNETLPICDVYATETHTINLPSSPTSDYYLTLIRTNNVPVMYHCYNQEHVRQLWSLFVWYMDKIRPLPPGELFDPYREQDEKRRRAEQHAGVIPPKNRGVQK